jgi:transcriptional regulator with XRE-family HTH domain
MATKLIDRRELGARLHMLRWRRGWSARHVEQLTGIPEASLLRWERAVGKRYPGTDRISRLADVYEVDLSELLDPDQDMRVWFNALRYAAA